MKGRICLVVGEDPAEDVLAVIEVPVVQDGVVLAEVDEGGPRFDAVVLVQSKPLAPIGFIKPANLRNVVVVGLDDGNVRVLQVVVDLLHLPHRLPALPAATRHIVCPIHRLSDRMKTGDGGGKWGQKRTMTCLPSSRRSSMYSPSTSSIVASTGGAAFFFRPWNRTLLEPTEMIGPRTWKSWYSAFGASGTASVAVARAAVCS